VTGELSQVSPILMPDDRREEHEDRAMIELECPMCETALLVAPAAGELECRGCAITVALPTEWEWDALPIAA
jgi:hypothetical protein